MANGTSEKRVELNPNEALAKLKTEATFGLIKYFGKNSLSDLTGEQADMVPRIIQGLAGSSEGVEVLGVLARKVEGLSGLDQPLKEIKGK